MMLALLLTLLQGTSPSTPSTEAYKFDYLRTRDRIEADGRAQRTLEVSVLLRTAAAVSQFGQISVPYVDGFGDSRFESLRVTKPGGESRPVKDSRVEDLNPFGINDASIPVDVRIRKITIPGLEPGDRLSYRLVTTFKPFIPGEAYGEMKFPAVAVEEPQVYELDIPAESRLRVNLRSGLGVPWETVPGEPGRLVRRLTVSVPPPVIASTGPTESQIALFQDPDVSFTTFTNWSGVGRWWWEMSKDQVRGDETIKKEAARIVLNRTTPREKIEAIAAFVGTSIRYLNVSFGMGRMQPRTATSVLASRFGDCKDKVGLVMALAEAEGIEVRPVLIHSARFNLQDNAPGPHQFDHVIAAAILGPTEKDWLWMDVTNALSSPQNLFSGLRDKRALVVDRTGASTIVQTPALPPYPTKRSMVMTGTLDPAGALKGHLRLTDRSDNEPSLRGTFASVAPEQHVELVRSLLTSLWKDARFSNVRAADPVDITNPFWVEADFEREVSGIDAEKEWKLWIPDSGPVLVEPSADTTAKKAVWYDVSEFSYQATIELPPGTTARAPLSISMERPFVHLTSKYSVDGNTLKVDRLTRFLQPFIARDQVTAYEAMRKASDADRKQDFTIGPLKAPTPAAAALLKEGNAARERKEFARAVEVLQRAATADPKLKGVYFDLGLAQRDLKKYKDAVEAFSKAIEADPFHEKAYAERAYSLFELDRDEEAEKDLLKQIEVAPFEKWSYGRLAQVRDRQGRYLEAAELYSKSLAIDGTEGTRWIDAAWAYLRGGNLAESRKCYEKARSIGFKDGEGVRSAFGYRHMGDLKTAALLAQEDLEAVQKNVNRITPRNITSSYLYWVRRLAEAWMIIGEAALEANDIPKAQNFLKASWEYAFLPDAAFALGRIRERQGKPGEALELWSAAATLGNWDIRPADLSTRIDKLRKGDSLNDGSQEMKRLRFITVPGVSAIDARAEVLIMASAGKVTGATNTSKEHEAELAPAISGLIGLPLGLTSPDGLPVTLLRAGTIICSTRSGCQFVARIEAARPPMSDFGSIAIVRLIPADKSELQPGSTVRLQITAEYQLEGSEEGHINLALADDRYNRLGAAQPKKVVKPGKGTVDFDFEIKVPEGTKQIRLAVPLGVADRPTSTVALASFSVKDRRDSPAKPSATASPNPSR